MKNRNQKANDRSTDFFDPDTSTDKHDEIMIWLDANVNSIMLSRGHKVLQKTWEKPIVRGGQQYKTIVGYADMWACTEADDGEGYKRRFNHVLEVKSQIKNVGEVIRQIRQYQTFTNDCIFTVVCPDDKFAEILRSQGIGFVKCP